MKVMHADVLREKLQKNEITLVDVREPAEYQSESIEGAHLLPLGKVNLEALPCTSRPIVFHCQVGNRSQTACQTLLQDYPALELYTLEGGIIGWKRAGFPVQHLGRYVLPLDRQTQVALGLWVVTGVMLGHMVHPAWYLLSGCAGLALIAAGLTGWCGMAMMLAKMPWNRR